MDKWVEVRGFNKSLKTFKVCVQAEDQHIVLIKNEQGQYAAIDNACPHAGLPLEEGDVHDNIITCRFHGYSYALQNGKNIDFPDTETPAKVYKTKVQEGRVFVALEDQA